MPDYVTYPGIKVMVPVARASLPILVGASPRLEDAGLVLSEFVTNAVLHSRSGQGGEFHVGFDVKPGWLRLEVVDQGPKAQPTAPPIAGESDGRQPTDHGRGLLLVAGVADRWGHDSEPGAGTWWAEFAWNEDGGDA